PVSIFHSLGQHCDALLYCRPPVRIRRRISDELPIRIESASEVAVLLLRKCKPESRLRPRGLQLCEPLKRPPSFLRDDAVVREHGRLSEAGQPPRRLSQQANRVPVSLCGLTEPPLPKVHRCD